MAKYLCLISFIFITGMAFAEGTPIEKIFGETGLIPGNYEIQVKPESYISVDYKLTNKVAQFSFRQALSKKETREINLSVDTQENLSILFEQKTLHNASDLYESLIFRFGDSFSEKIYGWMSLHDASTHAELPHFDISSMDVDVSKKEKPDPQKAQIFCRNTLGKLSALLLAYQGLYSDKVTGPFKDQMKAFIVNQLTDMMNTPLP